MFKIAAGLLFIWKNYEIKYSSAFNIPPVNNGKKIYKFGSIERVGNVFMSTSAMEKLKQEEETKDEVVTVGEYTFHVSNDGIFKLSDRLDHANLLAAYPDKLVLLKLFAPWCRACKGLAPKYIMLSKDVDVTSLPIAFAEMSIVGNKDFVKSLGVLKIPSVQFYAHSEIIENFPCGPTKFRILKQKLITFINERIDPETKEIIKVVDKKEEINDIKVKDFVIDKKQLEIIRFQVPYFKNLTDKEFDTLVSKASLQSFEPGSIIFRQGFSGNLFFVIENGKCEMKARNGMEDPLTTPASYLGAAFNVLETNSFFGERSIITGEPYAATIQAIEKTRCLVFKQENFPESSVLSGKTTPIQERLDEVNEKYQVTMNLSDNISEQIKSANVANQKRGSVNKPDKDLYIDESPSKENFMLQLLIRFKRSNQAKKCFDYITMKHNEQLLFDNVAQRKRRSMLVLMLPETTYNEIVEIWKLLDKNNDGELTLLEMKRFMENIGEEKSLQELQDIFTKSHPNIDASSSMIFDDFIGIMAEAEFYYLFVETFKTLDKEESGFVKIGDLNNILCGMTDLVFDIRTHINVENDDMLIDYEQYSKMLLGADLLSS